MAADNGQRIEGVYFDGDAALSTDGHIGALILDASGNYTLQQLTASGGIPVDIVDATGITVDVDVQQYAVDAVAGAADIGMLQLAVRDDALTTLTPVDGDYTQLRTDSTGALWVKQSGDMNIADGGNSITVDAVNLDVRDLTHVSDSVKIGDGTDFLAINGDGSINANFTAVSEDETHAVSAVAKGANADVVTYSPGATERQKSILVSALGYAKWTVSYGTTASEVVKKIFYTTPSHPTEELRFEHDLLSTETVIVNGLNLNGAAGNMDMAVSLQQE